MANITAANETPLESLPDAPDEEWFRNMLDRSNVFDRQVGAAFQRGITIAENSTSLVKSLDLVHGQAVTVANPLRVPIQGIFAIGCVGLSVGSDGKPSGGIYDLAIPDLQAKPSTRGDGSWVVQANYDIMPGDTTLQSNQLAGPISRTQTNGVGITTNVASNVCAQPSITVTPGVWDISGYVFFNPDVTTSTTNIRCGVSRTSATLPASDTRGVPTNGELSNTFAPLGSPLVRLFMSLPLIYTAEFSATTDLFLVQSTVFTLSTMQTFGSLEARRRVPYLTGRTGRVKLFFFGG